MTPGLSSLSRLSLFRIRAITAALAAVLFPFLARGAASEQGDESRYIHGSWVNVRTAPLSTAPVSDHLIINSKVTLKSDGAGNDYCGIAWSKGEGFVACKLLGKTPLSLEEVANPYEKDSVKPNPMYSPARAFWIDPNINRLFTAGKYFEKTLLSEKQRAAEAKLLEESIQQGVKPAKPRRYPIPEFEAMKEYLRQGVQRGYSKHPIASWDDARLIASTGNRAEAWRKEPQWIYSRSILKDIDERLGRLLMQIELPAIGVSIFKDVDEIGNPYSSSDQLSAQFSIPFVAAIGFGDKFFSGGFESAYWEHSWDVGDLESSLAERIFKNTVSRDGSIRTEGIKQPSFGYRLKPVKNPEGNWCQDPFFSLGDNDPRLLAISGEAPSKKSANRLFFFYSKDPFQFRTAKVVLSQQRYKPDAGAWSYIRANVLKIDVDRDGIEDFVVWEGFTDDSPETLPMYRLVFVTVAGKWLILADDGHFGGTEC